MIEAICAECLEMTYTPTPAREKGLKRSSYYCEHCGKLVSLSLGQKLSDVALLLGEKFVNKLVADSIIDNLKNPERFEELALDLPDGQKLSLKLSEYLGVIKPSSWLVVGPFNLGLYLLKNILKEKTRMLKEETGITFDHEWVLSIISCIYSANRNIYPGVLSVKRLEAEEYLEKVNLTPLYRAEELLAITLLGNLEISFQGEGDPFYTVVLRLNNLPAAMLDHNNNQAIVFVSK